LGKRRKSREFALQALYQWNVTQQDASDLLGVLRNHFPTTPEGDEFAEHIVLGVLEHRHQIDPLIERFSEHWRLDRMSVIDRNILRIAIFEFLYCPEIPPKVTINEAIDLGRRFGSTDSGSFINGVLDRILKEAVRKPL
jgi:N utilization substance protein B